MAISLGVATAVAAGVAAAAAVAGGALGVVGAVMQHDQAKTNAKIQEENALAQQRQMEYNQRLSELEAQRVEAATAENVLDAVGQLTIPSKRKKMIDDLKTADELWCRTDGVASKLIADGIKSAI